MAELKICPQCKGEGLQAGWTDSGGPMKCVAEECDCCGGSGVIGYTAADLKLYGALCAAGERAIEKANETGPPLNTPTAVAIIIDAAFATLKELADARLSREASE